MTKLKKRSNLRDLRQAFRDSTYFKFYHDIFNDRRLLDAAQRYGYRIALLPHPQMQSFIDVFAPDPSIIQLGIDRELSYRDVYARSALAITDYSSAIFDFCYLRKPVVYTQFDKAEFFANHTYIPGYFEYERDGFGEVEYDLDSTVARIIEYMSSGCVLKDKYRRRIDDFFTFNDRNNCQRIFEKIMALEIPSR